MFRYAHTNLIAADWRRLSQFYQEAIGCVPKGPERNLSGPWIEKGTHVPHAQLVGQHLLLPGLGENGPTLEIFSYDETLRHSGIAANRRGFGHIAFQVDDVEEALAKVLAHGGSQYGEVVHGEVPGAGPITWVYAQDPEGNIIELQKWE
jgi:predicted enzyme related to lactoylglutathione lyase